MLDLSCTPKKRTTRVDAFIRVMCRVLLGLIIAVQKERGPALVCVIQGMRGLRNCALGA